MKVSNILISLKGSDILSIINDFLDIEGLNLENITINNGINIKGSFKKFINIKFEGSISDLTIIDGKIIGKFSRLKVYKLGMIRMVRSLALKIGFDFIKVNGIKADRDKIEVDLKEVIKDFKFLDLDIKEIILKEEEVSVEVDNLDLNLGVLLNKDEETKVEINKEDNETTINVENNSLDSKVDEKETKNYDIKDIEGFVEAEKEEFRDVVLYEGSDADSCEELEELVLDEFQEEAIKLTKAIRKQKARNDYYDKGRGKTKDKLEDKLPDNAKVYSDYIFIVPDLLALIYRLLKDERVPIKTKLSVSASIAYIVCPSDLIPSNIPVIGKIDDIAVLFFALNRLANDIPIEVIIENWSGKNEMILVLKNGLEYVTNFTGARNIEKIYKIVEELSAL